MMEVGEDVGEGLIIGIDNSAKNVRAASKRLAGNVINGFYDSNLLDASKTTTKSIKAIEEQIIRLQKTPLQLPDTSNFDKQIEQTKGYAKEYESWLYKLMNPGPGADDISEDNLKIYYNNINNALQKHLKEIEEIEARKTDYISYSFNERFNLEQQYIEALKKERSLSLAEELSLYKSFGEKYIEGTRQRMHYDDLLIEKQKEISDEIIRLNSEYDNAVSERAKTLYSFAGIFDEINTKTDVSGQKLIDNLRSQNDAMTAWSNNMQDLAAKGINEGLLAELRTLGPSAAAEIAALNSLSEAELAEYESLWLEKAEVARKAAEAELIELKAENEHQIKELVRASEYELDDYVNAWRNAGIDSGNGLIDGLNAKQGEIISAAKAIADSVAQTIQSALDIHSPSRLMRGFGVNVGEGLVQGMDNMIAKVAQSSARLSNAVQSAHASLSSSANRSASVMAPVTSTSSTVDQSRHFNPSVTIHTTDSGAKEMQRVLRKMAFSF